MPLKLYLGPMGAAKTLHLVADLNKLHEMGQKCLYINSRRDSRSGQRNFSTNTKAVVDILCPTVKADHLAEVEVSAYQVVGVDEGQFFEDLPEQVRAWWALGKLIIVAGLDGSFEQKPIGRILEIVPLAEPGKVIKLYAYCLECNRQGLQTETGFTKIRRNVEMKVSADGFCPGGLETYEPACQKHL